jgi:hypothetical protein
MDFYNGGLEAKMSPFVIRCVKKCKGCTLDFIAREPEVTPSEEKTWPVDPTVFVSTETFGLVPRSFCRLPKTRRNLCMLY